MVEQRLCNPQVVGSIPAISSIHAYQCRSWCFPPLSPAGGRDAARRTPLTCGYRPTVRTPAFQAGDTGSIPATRSTRVCVCSYGVDREPLTDCPSVTSQHRGLDEQSRDELFCRHLLPAYRIGIGGFSFPISFSSPSTNGSVEQQVGLFLKKVCRWKFSF